MLGVPITYGEIYDALQKGTLDAYTHAYGEFAFSLRTYELGETGWILDVGGVGSAGCIYAINESLWNSMPPDIQNIVKEELQRAAIRQAEICDGQDVEAIKVLLDHGITITKISGADLETMKKVRETADGYWQHIGEAEPSESWPEFPLEGY